MKYCDKCETTYDPNTDSCFCHYVRESLETAGYTPEMLAEKFHTLYEAFAPEYSYETRAESAVPWEDVPDQNKKLMIRVCRTILGGV